ncbi:MAG: tripartite tricarboxylate transporter substrate binding protein [Betaproteobacteria bacterium]|nr:tripartite tricarboxylate transporter substrate binding protein [Betaproteobacteria bacterium]
MYMRKKEVLVRTAGRIVHALPGLLFAIAVSCGGTAARAADRSVGEAAAYPARPLRFIVPSSPGGANEVFARILAARMTANWGQQVIVDTRPGASGIIGTQIMARAAPDGYTFLIVANGHALNPYLHAKLPYDTLKDLDHVTLFAIAPVVLVVHPSVPAQSLQELMALAKAKPSQLNYASSGVGSGGWLAFELLRNVTRLDMVHVPYKGAGQANAAVLAGEVKMHFTSVLTAAPLIKAGRVRALAVTSAKRASLLEQVPAMAEHLPGYEVLSFFGILVPAGTPKPIIAKLHREIARITALPDVRSQFAELGVDIVDYGPEKFTAYVKSEMAKWSKVFAERGIRPEQ